MKRRISALLLSACLLLSVPAMAAPDSTANFVRSRTYQGQFSDLTAASSFYPNVTALYEYGLSVGKSDGTFGLTDSVTVSQVIIFAGRIRSLYRTGDPQKGPDRYGADGQAVSARYLLYLQAEGLLGDELNDRLYLPATRAEVAHILAGLLPAEALPPVYAELVNEGYATHRFIPDVTEYTPYFRDILQLYRTGVSQGSDRKGTYFPGAPITRGAVAAMLTRMVDPLLRTHPTWYSAEGQTLAGLVRDAQPVAAPRTLAEMDACVRHMLHSGSHFLRLQYPSLTEAQAGRLLSLALTAMKAHCEQGYNSASCTYTAAGRLTITFSSTAVTGELLESCRSEAMSAAIYLHDLLWEDGTIQPSMSDREKAQVYFEWLCDYTSYDALAKDDSISHLPYGLFFNQKAVCDGYTGAYNLLLKLEGIPCSSLFNEEHIWTVAELDGEEVHIDVTWADREGRTDLKYFAMTPEVSRQYHSWN